ncbi:MAG TPA: NHL repeat-containing protein [Candidatus Kapabacteria bacterium]|nr:NHL repeat-containing protein [Candidatus Kapabacteria bacterium]
MALISAFSFGLFACSSSRPALPTFDEDHFLGSLTSDRTFGHFSDASSFSFDGFGNIYVADNAAQGIYKFSPDGDSLRAVFGTGSAHGQFDSPSDIDALLTNSVVVADKNNDRIEIYSHDLIYQATIEGHKPGSAISFGYPENVRCGSTGYYYIIDGENHRLLSVNPAAGTMQVIGGSNSTPGIDLRPVSIAVDAGEYVATADANFGRLLVFNNSYLPVNQWRYRYANQTRLTATDDEIISFDANSNVIRTFASHDLAYHGSYQLPPSIVNPVMAAKAGGKFYILSKDRIVVCSIRVQ